MSKAFALLISSVLIASPVVYAQSQAGSSSGGASSAAGAAAGSGAIGATVGVAVATAAAVAVTAAGASTKIDPVYVTTGTGTNTKRVCIAGC